MHMLWCESLKDMLCYLFVYNKTWWSTQVFYEHEVLLFVSHVDSNSVTPSSRTAAVKHLSGMSQFSMGSIDSGEITSSSQDDDEEQAPPLPLKQKTSLYFIGIYLISMIIW